ncbi:GNAT family N-acetyltransferase [Deinococcus detaillensis]|uniref:GNAT family N-acetyltransferase n=1 Tax=Deinococcus detaillensis TaxID=2592048 RepID=A0A553V0D6_9DEIO|nr:GNAT family N-acetyltransferase [Deinococcus detaillensis]
MKLGKQLAVGQSEQRQFQLFFVVGDQGDLVLAAAGGSVGLRFGRGHSSSLEVCQTQSVPPTIRLLQAKDAAPYRELRLRALTEDPAAYLTSAEEYAQRSPDEIAARLGATEQALTLGAFLKTKLIGMATLVRLERYKQRHRADVVSVYVAPEARGRGVAAELMRRLIDQARQQKGLEVLGLRVTETQVAARRLYEKLGFELWGVQPDALRKGEAALTELHLQLKL